LQTFTTTMLSPKFHPSLPVVAQLTRGDITKTTATLLTLDPRCVSRMSRCRLSVWASRSSRRYYYTTTTTIVYNVCVCRCCSRRNTPV